MTMARLVQKVKERPIIFGAEKVRRILEWAFDRNGFMQTRRVVKPHPWVARDITDLDVSYMLAHCPYGRPGDRLWVAEAWYLNESPGDPDAVGYAADNAVMYYDGKRLWSQGPADWLDIRCGDEPLRPPAHMPRWASRITLELTDVRVEKLQDINTERHDEVLREGWPFEPQDLERAENPVNAFRRGWDKLNAKRGFGWDKNPWVWVLSFRLASDTTQTREGAGIDV